MKVLPDTKAYCEKHDVEYDAGQIQLREMIVISPCPECIKEAEEASRLEKERELQFVRDQEMSRKFMRANIPPRYTTRNFNNFSCQSKEQQVALEKAKIYSSRIAENMKTGASLILTGKPGTGKTHLACAVANEFISSGGKALFITVSGMIRKIRESYRRDSDKTEQEAINEFRDIPLLIIDEVGIQKGSESEEHLLFEVINERYSYFRPTIIISNETLVGIKNYIGERAMDRMVEGGGDFIQFTWDSYRSKVKDDENLGGADEAKYTQQKKTEYI